MSCFHDFHKHHCLFSNIGILKDFENINYHNAKLISRKMNSYKGSHKKCTNPYNHMSAVVETSLFCPQNVRFFNSKLAWVVDTNQTIFCFVYCICITKYLLQNVFVCQQLDNRQGTILTFSKIMD